MDIISVCPFTSQLADAFTPEYSESYQVGKIFTCDIFDATIWITKKLFLVCNHNRRGCLYDWQCHTVLPERIEEDINVRPLHDCTIKEGHDVTWAFV